MDPIPRYRIRPRGDLGSAPHTGRRDTLDVGLRHRLLVQDEWVLGTVMSLNALPLTELLAHAGYDFILMDMQHGDFDVSQLEPHVQACLSARTHPLVRVWKNDPDIVLRTLDRGCIGIVIPQVEVQDDIARAVRAAKYFPEGERSMSNLTAAGRWGAKSVAEHIRFCNMNTTVIGMVETVHAVENIDDITNIEGLDAVLIGTTDLSISLGLSGERCGAEIEHAIKNVVACCHRKRVRLGIAVNSPDEIHYYKRMGIRMFVTNPIPVISEAVRMNAESLKNALGS